MISSLHHWSLFDYFRLLVSQRDVLLSSLLVLTWQVNVLQRDVRLYSLLVQTQHFKVIVFKEKSSIFSPFVFAWHFRAINIIAAISKSDVKLSSSLVYIWYPQVIILRGKCSSFLIVSLNLTFVIQKLAMSAILWSSSSMRHALLFFIIGLRLIFVGHRSGEKMLYCFNHWFSCDPFRSSSSKGNALLPIHNLTSSEVVKSSSWKRAA